MPNRASDWFYQVARDLEQAEDSRIADRRHERACFVAQTSSTWHGFLTTSIFPLVTQTAIPWRPYEHYSRLQSEEAIKYARSILEFVRSQMAR